VAAGSHQFSGGTPLFAEKVKVIVEWIETMKLFEIYQP